MAKFKPSNNSNSNETNKQKKKKLGIFGSFKRGKNASSDQGSPNLDKREDELPTGFKTDVDDDQKYNNLDNSRRFLDKVRQKKVLIPLTVVVVLLLGYVTYEHFAPSKGEQKFAKVSKNAPKNEFDKDKINADVDNGADNKNGSGTAGNNKSDKSKKETENIASGTDADKAYFKQNTVFNVKFLPSVMNEDIINNKSVSRDDKFRTGSLSYVDPKASALTSLTFEDKTKPNISATLVANQQLYGFAAFKDNNTDKWVRIPNIQPIPKLESKYKDFGGTTDGYMTKEIAKRHAKADQIYNSYKAKNTMTELDMGSDIDNLKNTDPNGALNKISNSLSDNASKIAEPLNFYLQDSFDLNLTPAEAQKVDSDKKLDILGKAYYGLVTMKAISDLNKVAQQPVAKMLDNWGLKVNHTVYLYTDRSFIVIDGVGYNYSNIILDLYDNPDGNASGESNALGTNSTEPLSQDYVTQIFSSGDAN